MADTAALTRDALLGGRVIFHQPARGYRAAIDPVLLAASVPADLRGRVADLGCGAGAAALCVAARVPGAEVVGIERDAALAELARRNVAANDLGTRISVLTADIRTLPASWAGEGFDAVIANPPYLEPVRANPVGDARKAAATVEADGGLAVWVDAALRLVRRKGIVAFIQRADRLGDLLDALRGRGGDTVVFPLWPKAGAPAKRVIVRARKSVRSPLVLASGLVLHEAGGAYTAAVDAILREGAALEI